MELDQSSEFDTSLTNPNTFYNNLTELSDRMPMILEIFNTAYVNYNIVPNSQEYQNAYLNVKNNIISTNGSLFILSNDIENNIKLINENLNKIDTQIQKEKKLNNLLKLKSNSDTDKINASNQMIDDYKEVYNLKYLNNFNILIGIFIGIFMCKKIFK